MGLMNRNVSILVSDKGDFKLDESECNSQESSSILTSSEGSICSKDQDTLSVRGNKGNINKKSKRDHDQNCDQIQESTKKDKKKTRYKRKQTQDLDALNGLIKQSSINKQVKVQRRKTESAKNLTSILSNIKGRK